MGIRTRKILPRRHRLAALAAGLFLLTQGEATPGVAATNGTGLVSEQVFSVAYGKIAEVYLQPVSFAKLGLDGLRGLATIDPTARAERAGNAVRLYVLGSQVAEYMAPSPTDPAGWAAITTRMIDRARLYSPTLFQATPERLYQAVLDAVTADLDGYSRYTGTQRATNERAQREGYGGIGVSLDTANGRTFIRNILPHGPADHAGLRNGDQLLAIDGDLTQRLTDNDMRDHLRGPSGTLVQLTVARDGGPPRRVAIRRDRVVPNTVSMSVNGPVGVLKVDRFNASTAANLREAVLAARTAIGPGLRGYVLDLRGNPGGLLDQAVSVADLFISQGKIITTQGRNPDSNQRFDAAPDDIADGRPIVVLVDGRSASSAEVVAASLQDSGRAVVVGSSSYGKGSVQTVTRLPNDGELFLTWSRIYTPAGYTLHREGVQPTICTSRGDATDPNALLADLRDGRMPQTAQLALWRAKAADDETALNHLRETCPWKQHEPEIDLKVALTLLADPVLYQRASAIASTNTVAER